MNSNTTTGDILDDLNVCRDPFDEDCTASLDDNEGFDGACGNCADRLYANECDDDDGDDDDASDQDLVADDGGDVEVRS